MIEKKTKIIFADGNNDITEEFAGGLPLSKGEIVHIHRGSLSGADYEVVDKTVDCYLDADRQIIDITYKVKKK